MRKIIEQDYIIYNNKKYYVKKINILKERAIIKNNKEEIIVNLSEIKKLY